MEQVGRRALGDGTRAALTALVIVGCLAAIGWTVVGPYLGDIGGSLGTTACIRSTATPPGVPEGSAVMSEHSWFPLGPTCRYETGAGTIVQGPGWSGTITASTAALVAMGAATALIRDARSRQQAPRP